MYFLVVIPFQNISIPQDPSNRLSEDFETIKKPAYTPENVDGKIGRWLFDDALIGSSESDVKNAKKSVRIRNAGKVGMCFDLRGPMILNLQSASYGNDESSNWAIYISYDSGLHYQQLGLKVNTKAGELLWSKFYISNNGKFRIEVRKESNGKNRINVDDITFISIDYTTRSTTSSNTTDISHKYNITPKTKASISNDNVNMLLGNPDNAKHNPQAYNHYLIDEKYYVISYSKQRAEPNWVSWHLSSSDLGLSDRQNDFRYDANLPSGWYAVQPEVYKYSGFDKGHNCPSGDRTANVTANSITFLMDNIIPQAPNNNQHVWEHLESYCRVQVKRDKEAYIICGSYGKGGVGKNGYMEAIDHGRVCVPSHLWKIIIILPQGTEDITRLNADTRIIAVDIPNKNDVSSDWMNYLCTIKDIENKTGYKFLTNVPLNIANTLKSKTFRGGD